MGIFECLDCIPKLFLTKVLIVSLSSVAGLVVLVEEVLEFLWENLG